MIKPIISTLNDRTELTSVWNILISSSVVFLLISCLILWMVSKIIVYHDWCVFISETWIKLLRLIELILFLTPKYFTSRLWSVISMLSVEFIVVMNNLRIIRFVICCWHEGVFNQTEKWWNRTFILFFNTRLLFKGWLVIERSVMISSKWCWVFHLTASSRRLSWFAFLDIELTHLAWWKLSWWWALIVEIIS